MGKISTIYYYEMESPIDILTIGKSEKGICFIEFGTFKENKCNVQSWLTKRLKQVQWKESRDELEEAITQLNEYFKGVRQTFQLPLHLIGSPFQLDVWSTLKEIPYGETRSYKQIALAIQNPNAVRAVGGANNRNPVPIIIPCHRVIGSDGSMVGYGGGLDKKEFLLNLEGALQKISS